MILKLQRPISSNEPNPRWLAYDKTHSFETFFYPAPKTAALFKQDDAKIYVEAKPLTEGAFEVIKRVPEQDW
jgi:hypothetical protein